jgi:hypothetical protein
MKQILDLTPIHWGRAALPRRLFNLIRCILPSCQAMRDPVDNPALATLVVRAF